MDSFVKFLLLSLLLLLSSSSSSYRCEVLQTQKLGPVSVLRTQNYQTVRLFVCLFCLFVVVGVVASFFFFGGGGAGG